MINQLRILKFGRSIPRLYCMALALFLSVGLAYSQNVVTGKVQPLSGLQIGSKESVVLELLK